MEFVECTAFVMRHMQLSVQPRALEESGLHYCSWRIYPALADTARTMLSRGKTVKVLLAHRPAGVRDSDRHEVRLLIDLRETIVPIEFSSPGMHRLIAALVSGDDEKSLHNRYLRRKAGIYALPIIDSETPEGVFLNEAVLSHARWHGMGDLKYVVPEEGFAPTPGDAQWVNRWFGTMPRTACEYIARRAVAYTIQPFVVAAHIALRSMFRASNRATAIILFVLLRALTVRGITLRAVMRRICPLRYLWRHVRLPWLVPRVAGHYVLVPLTISPFGLMVLAGTTAAASSETVGQVVWFEQMGALALCMSAVLMLISVLVAIVTGDGSLLSYADGVAQNRAEARRYDIMVACAEAMMLRAPDPRQYELSRTQALWFWIQAQKARFCRRFHE